MADTLKFGPEWLRQLSGGNSVGTPPPSPAPGFGKYKLADYRYGREEMLALYIRYEEVPEELQQFNAILSEKAQDPLAFQPPNEDEQRIMSQSVNSQAVLRMMGRGAPPIRGRGAGGGIERGRGRGRGRGDGFMQRSVTYEETEAGGFGRPRQRPDGSWDEGDPKAFQRPYPTRYTDPTQPSSKIYQRSLSSENWRDREEDDDDGDWRRAGSKWSNARGSWRDSRGYDYAAGGPPPGRGGFRQYNRSRSGENWDEDLPEWSMDGDADELGTFDASGAFVSPQRGGRGYGDDMYSPRQQQMTEQEWEREKMERDKINGKGAASQNREKDFNHKEKDINDNSTKNNSVERTDSDKSVSSPRASVSPRPSKSRPQSTPTESVKDAQTTNPALLSAKQKPPSDSATSPSSSPIPPRKTESNKALSQKNPISTGKEKEKARSKQASGKKSDQNNAVSSNGGQNINKTAAKNVADKANKVQASGDNRPDSSAASKDSGLKAPPGGMQGKGDNAGAANATGAKTNKRREKLKSEAEALDQLQETVENMVAGITVLEDEDEAVSPAPTGTTTVKSGALPADHEDYNKWFYRDPQGDLQGPFASNEMAEWFSAGYFTMNLQVRRGCDEIFSPLGELIKRLGRIPFVSGSSPKPQPLMNSSSPEPVVPPQQQQQEQLQALQQQYLLQQQLVQQQMLVRHLQLQQIQQIMAQLQDNEQFKALPPVQQQQLAMQMMLKQGGPTLPTQPNPQKLSPRSSEAVSVTSSSNTSQAASYNRSYSTPNANHGGPAGAGPGQSSLPASIWDIDPATIASMPTGGISASDLEAQLKDKESHAELKHRELMERQKEELRKQQEELQRQKEEIERERIEIERRKQEEIKKIEEERLKAEEEKERQRIEEEHRAKLIEEQRTRLEEQRARQMEEQQHNRRIEEQRRQLEEVQRREEEERSRLMEEEMRRQKELDRQKEMHRQQELQKQQEAQQQQRQREQEEFQRSQEIQRQEELLRKQQQEALRKLQQEQLANMQLPSHAQWANSQSPIGGMSASNSGKSLLEIQQQEESERMEREEMQRKLMEAQRQQMLTLQQQQQQKSWTSTTVTSPPGKSLLEIQQEQARQLERERQKREENQQMAAKNLSLGAASVWGSSPPTSNWANEGAWGAIKSAQLTVTSGTTNNSLGFWDDAIISSSGPVKKQSNKQSKQQGSGDFPALGGNTNKSRPTAAASQNKAKPSKSKKEEEAVQRLFQTSSASDDFTQWCQKQLRNMSTTVDIPTFIAFLQEVDSPYEVHDYIRSYLGENKASEEFGKAFLEKRSQYRNKSKPVQQEMDSIWGPAPAITPRELRQQPNPSNDESSKSKATKKKKNKMLKMDASILGFTVHAAPDRMVGEIDAVEATNTR